MAKRLLFLAAGALALTACTSSDVIDDVASSRNVIQFENVVDKLTRAEDPKDLTSGNLSQFSVFGYYTMPNSSTVANEVFDDIVVERLDNGTWTYNKNNEESKNRYWVKDAKYYFYAYSCGDVTKLNGKFGKFKMDMSNGLMPSSRVLKIEDYLCDNTHQHDLIFASNTGATETDAFAGILGSDNNNTAVAFQFKHLLSKVKARFTSKFPAEYEVEITDVSIQNIRSIGDYNPTTGWQNVRRPEGEFPFVYLLNTSNPKINPISVSNKIENDKQASCETETAFVIPYGYNGSDGEGAANTWVYIKFTIKLLFNKVPVLTKELTGKFNPNWEAGFSYIYNVEVSGSTTNMDVITFTTTTNDKGEVVNSWNENDTPVIDIDQPNKPNN